MESSKKGDRIMESSKKNVIEATNQVIYLFRPTLKDLTKKDYNPLNIDYLIDFIKKLEEKNLKLYLIVTSEHFYTGKEGVPVPFDDYNKKMKELEDQLKLKKSVTCFVHSYIIKDMIKDINPVFDLEFQKSIDSWAKVDKDSFPVGYPSDVENLLKLIDESKKNGEKQEAIKNIEKLKQFEPKNLIFSVTNAFNKDQQYISFKTQYIPADKVTQDVIFFLEGDKGKDKNYYFSGYPKPLVDFSGPHSTSTYKQYLLRVCGDSSCTWLKSTLDAPINPKPIIIQADSIAPGNCGVIRSIVGHIENESLYTQEPLEYKWPESITVSNPLTLSDDELKKFSIGDLKRFLDKDYLGDIADHALINALEKIVSEQELNNIIKKINNSENDELKFIDIIETSEDKKIPILKVLLEENYLQKLRQIYSHAPYIIFACTEGYKVKEEEKTRVGAIYQISTDSDKKDLKFKMLKPTLVQQKIEESVEYDVYE